MGGQPVRPRLMKHFESHPGVNIYAADLVQELGLTSAQVRAGIANLRRESSEWRDSLRVIQTGQVWRYVPGQHEERQEAKKVNEMLFRHIGTTAKGSLVLESEEGKLYRAELL